jgi:hypothetical protein
MVHDARAAGAPNPTLAAEPPLNRWLREKLAAWADSALDLACWAQRRLVNRRDVWGAYELDDTGAITAKTRPRVADRGRVELRTRDLAAHFEATDHRKVIGLHTASEGPDSTALWGAVDIDRKTASIDPALNFRLALHWHDVAASLGFRPLLTTSNDHGGYHLRTLFASPIPLTDACRFLRWLVRDYSGFGLDRPPETFPKQAKLAAAGERGSQYGNWLRLPGRRPADGTYSQAWDGREWLAGRDAVNFVLTFKDGDSPTLIPSEARSYDPPAVRVQHVEQEPAASPRPARPAAGRRLTKAERIAAYASKADPAIEGHGGYLATLSLTTNVAKKFGPAVPEMLDGLREWMARCQSPWTEDQILPLVESASAKYGGNPTCNLDDGKCGLVDGWPTDRAVERDECLSVHSLREERLRKETENLRHPAPPAAPAAFPGPAEYVADRDAKLGQHQADAERARFQTLDAERRERCPHRSRYQRDDGTYFYGDCGRLDCRACGATIRARQLASLTRHAEPFPTLYVGEVALHSYDAAVVQARRRRRAERRRGDERAHGHWSCEFRLNKFFLVSSSPFDGSGDPVPVAEALRRTNEVLAQLGEGTPERPFHSSRSWTLLKGPKKRRDPSKRVTGITRKCTNAQLSEALQAMNRLHPQSTEQRPRAIVYGHTPEQRHQDAKNLLKDVNRHLKRFRPPGSILADTGECRAFRPKRESRRPKRE